MTITFDHDLGDLDLRLLNAAGTEVARSDGVGDVESISLSGRAEGWYYAHVYGYASATNPAFVQMFEVARSRRMCCSRVASVRT